MKHTDAPLLWIQDEVKTEKLAVLVRLEHEKTKQEQTMLPDVPGRFRDVLPRAERLL